MAPRVRFDGGVCIFLALAIFLVPLKFLLGAVLAAAFHELCHAVAILFAGGKILAVNLHAGGAEMETTPMTDGREVLCALAGPAGSLLLLTLARWAPEMALCAGLQGAFNLLPIYPLDGGRAVGGVCRLLFGDSGSAAAEWMERITLAGLTLLSARLGLWPMIFTLLVFGWGIWKKNSLQRGQTRCTIGS